MVYRGGTEMADIDRIERAIREHVENHKDRERATFTVAGVSALLDELSRRSEVIERAKEALAPFADACGHFDGYVKDDDNVSLALQHIKARHLRAARALLQGESK
jgi:hypothetical protein